MRPWQNLRREINEYRQAFEDNFNSAIEAEMGKFREFVDLGVPEKNRLTLTVRDAARHYHSAAWGPIFKQSIQHRPRMIFTLTAGTAILCGIITYAIPHPDQMYRHVLSEIHSGAISDAIITAFVICVICAVLNLRAPSKRVILILATEATIVLTALAESNRWVPDVPSAWKSLISLASFLKPKYRAEVSSAPIATVLQWTLWLLAVACIALIIRRITRYWIAVIISGQSIGYAGIINQYSTLIVQLIEINKSVNELIAHIKSLSSATLDKKVGNEMWRLQNSLASLAGLAASVGDGLPASAQESYGPTGQMIASRVPRIKFFFNYHAARNLLVGDNLIDLQEAMSDTLVKVADGDWDQLGANHDDDNNNWPAKLAGRGYRIVRRLVAVFIPIGGIIVVERYFRNLPPTELQPIIVILLGWVVLGIIGVVDPDSTNRLQQATQIAGLFKRNG